jgi:hypothetical protein
MHLARALPPLLAIVCEDVFGAAAEAREAASAARAAAGAGGGAARAAGGGGCGGGGGADRDLVVREARTCRSFESFELLARCAPFPPRSGAVHALTAPHVAALESSRRLGGARSAGDGGQWRTQRHCAELFRRLQLGLAANASACGPGAGPFLVLYCHGVCAEFLGLSAQAAAAAEGDARGAAARAAANAAAAAGAAVADAYGGGDGGGGGGGDDGADGAGAGAGPTPSASAGGVDAPRSVRDAFARGFLARARARGGARRLAPVAQWNSRGVGVGAAGCADAGALFGGSGGADGGGEGGAPLTLTAAMRQRGAGPQAAARHGLALRVLSEPQMTGAARFANERIVGGRRRLRGRRRSGRRGSGRGRGRRGRRHKPLCARPFSFSLARCGAMLIRVPQEWCRLVSPALQKSIGSLIADIGGSANTWRYLTPSCLRSCEARPIQAPTARAAGPRRGNGAAADKPPAALRRSIAPSLTGTRRHWKSNFCHLSLAQRNAQRTGRLQKKSVGRRLRQRPPGNRQSFRGRCIAPPNT